MIIGRGLRAYVTMRSRITTENRSTKMEVTPGLIVILVLYMLPALIAALRKHRQQNPIFILNLFFGWTLIGWVGLLGMVRIVNAACAEHTGCTDRQLSWMDRNVRLLKE